MKISTARAEFFSDGVMAIIITIMVLELKLPDFENDDTSWETTRYLKHLLPHFSAYAFSFMMIGIFWSNHHYMFHLLEHTDVKLTWLNLIFLFWVSIVPLATALIGAGLQVPESVATYGFVMLMVSFFLTVMRNYALKQKLLHREKDIDLDKKILKVSVLGRTKSILGTVCYLASIPLAFVNVYLAYVCLVIPPIIFFIPDGIDDEKLAEKIDEKNS